jgi:hypothetical protein
MQYNQNWDISTAASSCGFSAKNNEQTSKSIKLNGGE